MVYAFFIHPCKNEMVLFLTHFRFLHVCNAWNSQASFTYPWELQAFNFVKDQWSFVFSTLVDPFIITAFLCLSVRWKMALALFGFFVRILLTNSLFLPDRPEQGLAFLQSYIAPSCSQLKSRFTFVFVRPVTFKHRSDSIGFYMKVIVQSLYQGGCGSQLFISGGTLRRIWQNNSAAKQCSRWNNTF